MNIHPTAVVSPEASLAADVTIGPLSIIESGVVIGEGCVLEGRVVVKSGTTLGRDNYIAEGAILGGLPQHAHMPEVAGRVTIGSGNTIRENVTVHRALHPDEATTIGDGNLVMVNAHVAHDCRVGNQTIITNNVLLAGHVIVEDRAYLSGAVAIHQFCRVGTLAMVGGQAHLVKDVPPFVTVDGLSSMVVGLNRIGLRRAGFDLAAMRQLKAAYRVIYRSRFSWAEILGRLKDDFAFGPACQFHPFLSTSARGIISERRGPVGATIKIHRDVDATPDSQANVG